MIEGTTVIDFHGHTGRWDYYDMNDDATTMLHTMDAVGIDKSCLFHIFHPDSTPGNDITAQFIGRNPDRFIGFAYISPLVPENILPELERSINVLKLSAIKLYSPYTPYKLDHPIWDPIYQFAHDGELVVIAHTGNDLIGTAFPEQLGNAAPRFPNAIFVAGHAGNAEPCRSQAIAAAQRSPNFYLETCSTFRTPGVIEELVAKAGADRVLFGSDTPLMDPRSQIGKIITADISDEDKRLILGENARRVLKL